MHEDASQIKLHLETYVDISSVDSGRPPQGESSIGNLVETRSLGMSKFLVLHGLFEARGFLPEETFPSREVGTLEQSML